MAEAPATATTAATGPDPRTTPARAVHDPAPGAVDAGDLANLVEAAPDALLLVDAAGVILQVNRRVEELFGYGRHELVGNQVEILLPEQFRSAHEVHRDRYRSAPTVRNMGSGLDLYARRRDGSRVVVEVGLSPTTHAGAPAVIAAVRDISDRVAAEAHTRRIERLIDRAHEGVYLIDPVSMRFSYVNAGAAAQTGYGRRALLSMTPLQLIPDMDEAILRRVFERVSAQGRLAPIVARLRRADGEDLPVELLLERDESPAGGAAVAVLVRDLSERRESEEALDETREALALVGDRERIARDLHDRVIQRLFAIGMSLQATLDQIDDDAAATRLGRSVDDVDDTIREIRAVIFELQPPDHGESVRRRVQSTARDARTALGFEPRVQLDGPIDTMVSPALATELLATVQEGLSNVARHAHATSVEVGLTVDRDGQLTLEISDDGIGVPELIEPGNGLTNMGSRARRLGGELRLDRRHGRPGTRLVWRVPTTGD